MKYSVLSFVVLGILFQLSCSKDISEYGNENNDGIDLREGSLMENRECIDLVFPLGVVLPDRTILEAENEEALRENIKTWYANHPDVKERPGLNYPVHVIFEGDKSKIISNEAQMRRLKKYCADKIDSDRKICFKLIYPVSYLMPDETTITGNDAKEIRIAIKAWYAENPTSEGKPILNYPVDIKVKGGDIISVNNEDEMIVLKKRCREKNTDERDCFEMVFPISFEMPDGSTISVNDESDLETSIKAWYVNNPDSKDRPNLNYPVNVVFPDGQTKTINNEEEMVKLKKWCDKK